MVDDSLLNVDPCPAQSWSNKTRNGEKNKRYVYKVLKQVPDEIN